jgi:hypothetical protein
MTKSADSPVTKALKKRFSGIAPAWASMEMTYHKAGGEVIVTPYHGMVGWYEGEEYVYNTLYSPAKGWYRRAFYQAIRSIDLGQFDHRIITPDFYLTVSESQPEATRSGRNLESSGGDGGARRYGLWTYSY